MVFFLFDYCTIRMSPYAILFTSMGIGCMIGFCVKSYCFSTDAPIEPESDSESDNDVSEYVAYLENMLDNSTTVTTESVQLQPIESNYTNITSEFVYMTETIPSAPLQATVIEDDYRV
jgi:hypothetical protein